MNLAHIPTPAFHLGNLPACRLSASPHAPRRTPILLSPTILHTRSNTNTTIPTAKQKRVDHFTGQEAWIDTATHNDLAEEDLTLTAIRDALHIELSRGCIDVQGKSQTFLQYTERKFPMLSTYLTPEQNLSWASFRETFSRHYASMSREHRRGLLLDAQGFLNAVVAHRRDGKRDYGFSRKDDKEHWQELQERTALSVAQKAARSGVPPSPSTPASPPPLSSHASLADPPSLSAAADVRGAASYATPEGRHAAFLAAARQAAQRAVSSPDAAPVDGVFATGDQRTAVWHELRDQRLTASAFGNALGFWPGRRSQLWEEKLGLDAGFQGNDATRWGEKREAQAITQYERFTGSRVEPIMFKVYKTACDGWIGASPDGVVSLAGEERPSGLLEVKCPWNKGRPEDAVPPREAMWYYMPQVQGQMDLMDKDWCDLFVYTVNGSAIFRITRDFEYWRLCYSVLAEFWWEHLIPAKHALWDRGDHAEAEKHRPSEQHAYTQQLVDRSKEMVRRVTPVWVPADGTQDGVTR